MKSGDDEKSEVGRASARSPPGEGGLKSALLPPADESPGVPGFRTWGGVYWFAFGVFVAGVVALTIFSRVYA